MGIKPAEVLAYLYYACSECGNYHDELRIVEAERIDTLVCPICGHVDEIEPVTGIEVKFGVRQPKVEQPAPVTTTLNADDLKRAKKTLVQLGYSGNQAKLVIKRTITMYPRLLDYEDLVKHALVEAANVYAPSHTH